MPNVLELLSLNYEKTNESLNKILEINTFTEITFDEAIDLLVKGGFESLINFTEFGRDISAEGEIRLAEILNFKTPFWIRNYDRDRVAFYQKPDPLNPEKVINADLIFPSIIKNSFGGEIIGCGQRQNDYQEILESLLRQNIDREPYGWYMDLRRLANYGITSGFGLGIERFIAWSLCRDDIKDMILYPRLKNIKTYP
jgi:asparaginyl-tRNA synthetase